jgi:hypothetical protein
MAKTRKKTLTIKLNFVDDLLDKGDAYGLYYRLSPKSNTTNIYIDIHQDQLCAINTLYHELTHMVMDVMTNKRHYMKFFDLKPSKVQIIQAHKDISAEQEDFDEEILCDKIARSCEKKIKKYLEK